MPGPNYKSRITNAEKRIAETAAELKNATKRYNRAKNAERKTIGSYGFIPINGRQYGEGKPFAWWNLSYQAKQRLKAERLKGGFGGKPGVAPYWMSQERGEPLAQIVGQFYIKKSLNQWRSSLGVRVRSWVGRHKTFVREEE